MAITPLQVEEALARWGLSATGAAHLDALATYGNLLLRWNARISLTAIRDEAEIVERHIMEGVFAAAHHPLATTSLDFGSGTGVPGILIAVCRPEVRVTLAESQRKKAAFLAEAVRELHLNAAVHAARAETLPPASFDAVWMRAVDQSASMIPLAVQLLKPAGALCLLETREAVQPAILDTWERAEIAFPASESRVLHIWHRP